MTQSEFLGSELWSITPELHSAGDPLCVMAESPEGGGGEGVLQNYKGAGSSPTPHTQHITTTAAAATAAVRVETEEGLEGQTALIVREVSAVMAFGGLEAILCPVAPAVYMYLSTGEPHQDKGRGGQGAHGHNFRVAASEFGAGLVWSDEET